MLRFFAPAHWARWQAAIATGGMTFGILTAVEAIDLNGLLFQFLTLLASVIAAVLFGGDLSALTA